MAGVKYGINMYFSIAGMKDSLSSCSILAYYKATYNERKAAILIGKAPGSAGKPERRDQPSGSFMLYKAPDVS